MIVRTPEVHSLPPRTRAAIGRVSGRVSNAVQTKRLYLSGLCPDDLDDVRQVFAHKSVARMTHAIAHPFTGMDAKAFIDKARMNSSPRLPVFAVRDEQENLIGITSLDRTTCGQTGGLHLFGPSVGICIAPEFQGHGYGLEALEGLIGYAERFGGHRVLHAAHFADNDPSARMLARAGFLYTGRRTLEISRAREGQHEAVHMIRLL
ncbi:GNAT family N-acetyltransferase [Asticcacaulis sp. BYS171W]|uniref:GNAT family N-acetyltransferase n=1 Tax=Asticcacaulis aquaticus TaxID=2984212 RepID=A0ABT5HRJ5_9CAUL|nr:GNAT family N-acetyltransferase [Asticcacaulis aquaticus]MDC7682691.1 GNAT family N-acetyltransferase [Asticcacaulis aquaticus]